LNGVFGKKGLIQTIIKYGVPGIPFQFYKLTERDRSDWFTSLAASNMIESIIEHFHSIRFKIATALFLVLIISIGATMFGMWTYVRGQFIDMISSEAIRSGRTIEQTLRTTMLQSDKRDLLREEVNAISATNEPPSYISIINLEGRVAVSSIPTMIDRTFDRFTSSSCSGCHLSRDEKPKNAPFVIKRENGPLLRNVIKIKNTPECYRCHPAATNILGVLVYDVDLSRTYDLLKTVAFRMFLTGLVSFLVISLVLSLAINRLIDTPIRKLMQGFTEVGEGNYEFWVDEESSSEFGYMAIQFNVMNRAIGRFVEEIKGKNQETNLLYTIVQEISETIELERLKKIVINLMHNIFNAEQTGLAVLHQKQKDSLDILWRIKNQKRLGRQVFRPGDVELSLSAVTAEELEDWQRDKYLAHRFKDDHQRLLIPLYYSQQALGLICIRKMADESFTKHERAIIPALANHISISLANAHLYHLATTDGLTELYSKRHLLNKLDMLVARNNKYGNETFFVLILDIDHFKQVNDTHGHEVGDQVLVQLAELLRKNIRFEDIPFRYGGEEFVILVPMEQGNTDLDMVIAERLRAAVEDHTFECHEAPPIRQTISVGVASFPDHGKTAHDIIDAADKALYQAKHKGRNQICRATDHTET